MRVCIYMYVCTLTHIHTLYTQCKEVSCTRPGCVPLEVIITLILESTPQSSPQSSLQSSSSSPQSPSSSTTTSTSNNFKPSLSDLIKSGNYKAHIYKSAQSVTESDVKHVIPKCLGGAWDAKVEVQSLRLNLLNRIEGLEYNR